MSADFENQLAGRIVKEIDPTGKNTVYSPNPKTDADQTREVQLINQKYPLRSNWYLLKLPNRFFQTNELWRDFVQRNASRVGQRISQSISRIACPTNCVKSSRASAAQSLSCCLQPHETIAALPAELQSEPTAEVFTRVSQFAADISLYIDGNAPLDPDRCGLVQQLLVVYDEFKGNIRDTAPVFDAHKPATSGRLPGPEGASLDELDADGDSYTTRKTNAVRIEQVMHTAKEYIFGGLSRLTESYRAEREPDAPTSRCFDESLTIFTEELERIVLKHFGRYAHGSLLEVVRGAVAAHILDIAKIAKQGLGLANDHYLSAHKAKFLARYWAARTRQVPSPPRSPVYKPNTLARQRLAVPQEFSPAGIQDSEDDETDPLDEVLAALHRYSSSYNNVTAADLPKLLPTDGMEPAIDIIAEVHAYFKEGLGLFAPNRRQRCAAWVAEPPAIAEKRRELVADQVALINAQRELQRFG
ncbi:hypothetical protein BKA62DRAFT_820236 [Auriculariales sp. MPI-PUGE-AT-0066]|nr:hypothetical protein BKA62DRAFT_820236 [Auriculariales sp. MPI-PUGE-AT-0066]